MATICEIRHNNRVLTNFLTPWIEKLTSNLDASKEEFLASVLESFGKNKIALGQLQKMLEKHDIQIDILDLLPDQFTVIPEFENIKLTDGESEHSIFGTNIGLSTYIRRRFGKLAYKYCIIDTSIFSSSPLVQNNEDLANNISEFKQSIAEDLIDLLSFIISDPELEELSKSRIFDPNFGADGEYYEKLMQLAKRVIGEIDLKDFNVEEDEILKELIYNAFALTNFDTLLEESMKDIITISNKGKGDLNNTSYSLNQIENSELQDLQGINDLQYENALNFVTPDLKKIVSAIPTVLFNLGDSLNRFRYSEIETTLQLPQVLQLSAWVQTYLDMFEKSFSLHDLDLLNDPVYTIYSVLKGIHDTIKNWDSVKDVPLKTLIKKDGAIINTALSLYEYLFNDEDRIDTTERSIASVNRQIIIPKFNIINEVIQQMCWSVSPAFIEHNMDGTIWDFDRTSKTNPTSKNYILRALRNRVMFSIRNIVKRRVIIEAPKDNSELAAVIKGGHSKSLDLNLNTKAYLDAVRQLLGVSVENSQQLKQLLNEAQKELTYEGSTNGGDLKNMFEKIADVIQTCKPSNYKDAFEFHKAVNIRIEDAIDIDLDLLSRILAPLLTSAPTPTFQDRTGNQLGVYRTTSLVFMMDHLIKRYKQVGDLEMDVVQAGGQKYKPIRERSNFFVDNPLFLQNAGNQAYLSQVAIPLTMGNADINLEARKLPEFILDLHAFVGQFMSLMLGLVNGASTPILGFQLGTYSDKTTLPQMVVNGKITTNPVDGAKNSIVTFEKMLKNPNLLLLMMQAYQSTLRLDLVNKIITDWKKVLSALIDPDFELEWLGSIDEKNPSDIKESPRYLIEQLRLGENSEDPKVLELYHSILNFIQSNDITEELLSFGEGSHSALFRDFLKNPGGTFGSAFDSLHAKTIELRDTVLTSVPLLNEVLFGLSTKFMLEIVPLIACKLKIKIVENLHADKYSQKITLSDGSIKEVSGFEFNKMVLDDLIRDCSKLILPYNLGNDVLNGKRELDTGDHTNYYWAMASGALLKKYDIDGKEKTFFLYLLDYFLENSFRIREMIGTGSKDIKGRLGVFDSLYVDGKVNPTALANIYFSYLVLTDFLRHQALDLSVKEAYEDKAKNKKSSEAERSGRQQTTTKRNNTFTAPVVNFLMGLVNGVSHKTKLVMVEDADGGVFNTIGADRSVVEFDGLGLNSPIQVRMEDASLGKKHKVSTKKTFITIVDDYSAEELKWASNEITNKLIRESQGSHRPILDVFRRLHDIPFKYDITKLFYNEDSEPLYISLFLNKILYARDGFDYYKYDCIENLKDPENPNLYKITKVKIDPKTLDDIETVEEVVEINTIYDIYMAFNGINCMEQNSNGMLGPSENIMDLLYDLTWLVGEFNGKEGPVSQDTVYQPLRDAFKGIFGTHGSNKRGASNIIPAESWTNPDIPFSYSEVEIATGGEQLYAGHAADGSSITKGTQLMQDLALKGFSSDLVYEIYETISSVMDISSETFTEISELLGLDDVEGIQELISEKIVRSLEINGTTAETLNLIAAFKAEAETLLEPFVLPLSLIVKDVIKSYASEVNKNVIKQKDSGLMGTLNGSSGYVQVYNLNGISFVFDELVSQKMLSRFESKKDLILDAVLKTGIKFDEIIRLMSIIDINEGLDKTLNILSQADQDKIGIVSNPIETLILVLRNPELRFDLITDFFAENPEETLFLGVNKILPSLVTPGQHVLDDTGEHHLIELGSIILDIIYSNDFVYVDKLMPEDLKPQYTEIETESGHKENEYTSYEALLGYKINQMYDSVKNFSKDFGNLTLADIDLDVDVIAARIVDSLQIEDGDEAVKQFNSIRELIGRIHEPALHIKSIIDYLASLDLEDFNKYLKEINPKLNSDNLLDLVLKNDKDAIKVIRQLQEDMINFKNHIKSLGYTLKADPYAELGVLDFDAYYHGLNFRKLFEHLIQENIVLEELFETQLPDGSTVYPTISREELIRLLTFYKDHQASERKKIELEKILANEDLLDLLIVDHPQFIFKALQFDKNTRYQQYMHDHSDTYEKVVSTKTSTALIIMPSIYRGQMRLGNIDLVDVDAEFFRKAPTFYKVKDFYKNLNGEIQSDFIIRTFRGQYNIVVTDDLTDTDIYGTLVDVRTENGYRLGRKNEKLYKLPEGALIKKRDGVETIILKRSDSTARDIEQIVTSDSAIVSVQPILANTVNLLQLLQFVNMIRRLEGLNTIPSFRRTYLHIFDFSELSTSVQRNSERAMHELLNTDFIQAERDYNERYKQSMFISFIRSLDIIATRIPTQNMSSIMAMKVAAFTKSNINDVFVTKWQQWLQGADYDIDKAFILGYNFDDYGRFITWSPLQQMYDERVFESSLKLPTPSGFLLSEDNIVFGESSRDNVMNSLIEDYAAVFLGIKLYYDSRSDTYNQYTSDPNIQRIAAKYNYTLTGNSEKDFDVLEIETLNAALRRLNKVNVLCISRSHGELLYLLSFINRINLHNAYKASAGGLKNQATYLMHLIMNSPKNATTAYKSIDIATDAFNDPISELVVNSTIYNFDDGHSISSITVSGAVGKDDVGIGANGTKGLFTLLNYFNRIYDDDEPLSIEELVDSHHFNVSKININYEHKYKGEDGIDRVVIKNWTKYIGPVSDTIMTDGSKKLFNAFIQKYFDKSGELYLYDRDASQDVGALLSMAADNAKTLNLDKMHAETDYFAMHIFLAMVGCPPAVIIQYFNSPAFTSIIKDAKNDLAKGNIPRITKNTFINAAKKNFEHNPDLAREQLQLAEIFACALELTRFAQILSINLGIKVEESELCGQKQKFERALADAMAERNLFDPDLHLVDNGLFNPSGDIQRAYGDAASAYLIRIRMEKANKLMLELNINLSTPFDFNRFLNDSQYAEAIKSIMDVLKHNYNVFDIVGRAPHFYKMLIKYNELILIYSKAVRVLDFEFNEAPDLYNPGIVDIHNPNLYASDIYLPATYNKKFTPLARAAFIDKLTGMFLNEIVGPLMTFRYEKRNLNGPTVNTYCNFSTNEHLRRFSDFVSFTLVPKLFELDPENEFLLGLEINEQDVIANGNVFFGFSENLRTLGNSDMSGITKLFSILKAFDKIKDVRMSELFESEELEINSDMTVGDFLYLYNTIMKMANPRINDFSTLFNGMFNPTDLKMRFYRFAKDFDTGKRKITVDTPLLMAYIAKSQAYWSGDTKAIFFTDRTPSIELAKKEKFGSETKIISRYLLSIPTNVQRDFAEQLQDLLLERISNGSLKFTDIKIDCQ